MRRNCTVCAWPSGVGLPSIFTSVTKEKPGTKELSVVLGGDDARNRADALEHARDQLRCAPPRSRTPRPTAEAARRVGPRGSNPGSTREVRSKALKSNAPHASSTTAIADSAPTSTCRRRSWRREPAARRLPSAMPRAMSPRSSRTSGSTLANIATASARTAVAVCTRQSMRTSPSVRAVVGSSARSAGSVHHPSTTPATAAEQDEQKRLDQLEPHDGGLTGAERGAERDLRAARHHLRQRQVRQVRARDQDEREDAAQQHEQARALLPIQRVAQTRHVGRPAIQQRGRLGDDRLHGRLQLRRQLRDGDARTQARKRLNEGRGVVELAPVMFSGVQSSAATDAAWNGARHDANHFVRLAIDQDGSTEHAACRRRSAAATARDSARRRARSRDLRLR